MASHWQSNTPTRSGPGAYMQTPAPNRLNQQPAPSFSSSVYPQNAQPQGQQNVVPIGQSQAPGSGQPARPIENLTSAERAGKAINNALDQVRNTTSMEQEYAGGISYNYDLSTSDIWAPFQRVKTYTIPDQIFEQANQGQMGLGMGLFAELHYAYCHIDNALYMWDYTMANPELVGYEDQPYVIQKVKLAKPRAGVFLESINHMVIVATTDSIMLFGLGKDPSNPIAGLSLFQTGMSASIKGVKVTDIACSEKTGRVFFVSDLDNDVRELKYQAQDSWFASKCSVVNHTSGAYAAFTGAFNAFSTAPKEFGKSLVIDDSRNTLYTLSSLSTIRGFYLHHDGSSLELRYTLTMDKLFTSISHELQSRITPKTIIVSISPLTSQETVAWALMATTLDGYRIYLKGTFTYWEPRTLMSLDHAHTRTPPVLGWEPSEAPPAAYNQPNAYLSKVESATRFAPGYFFCALSKHDQDKDGHLFISVPGSQADALYVRPQGGAPESAGRMSLKSTIYDFSAQVPYRGATKEPPGFGNELAVQFDEPVPEIAVLTNTGVHVLRRKRFVDGLAGMIRKGRSLEGFETEVQNLIRKYGRNEILADALAVACGQSVETTSDHAFRINDPEILEVARKIFIEHGGKPSIDQNANFAAPIDAVRPSPRFEAAARYVSRLVRSTWKERIAREKRSDKGYEILCTVTVEKLRAVQENLVSLQKFFNVNKSFIRGLSGPDDLTRQASKDDEIALQGEHRALHSLVKFVTDMIEALSFVMVLFEEKVAEIVPLLPEQSRSMFMNLTFEQLVSTKAGYEVAKDLVKAIVNRNIAKGSNVETIAEALRRKCGNFCSSDDVVIFKAQEQLKRAAEAKANAEYSRNLLNESLKLFEQVAHSLPQEYLQSAVRDYIELQFFAGAIQLALKVAHEHDKTNDALTWMTDGKPDSDPRKVKFEERNRSYDLIHAVLEAIDRTVATSPPFVDGRPSLSAIRRDEAYDVLARSRDEVFLTNLYSWYLAQGWYDRLLETQSPFIVTFLQRKSAEDLTHADLLWKYYGNSSQFHEAARVQLKLAQSSFPLTLDRRIEYLSRARANASAFTTANSTINRKTKQKLLAEINSLIELANIQDEILARLRDDKRVAQDKRMHVLAELDGPVLPVSELYNKYADPAGYYDICLYIYAVADFRDTTQVKATWQQFLEAVHTSSIQDSEARAADSNLPDATPYEIVAERFREVGARLKNSEAVFPVPTLIEMLEMYNVNLGRDIGVITEDVLPGAHISHWIPDIFLELEIPYELIYDTLETAFFTSNAQGQGNQLQRQIVLSDLLYCVEKWLHASYARAGGMLFGGDNGQQRIEELLVYLTGQENERSLGKENWRWVRTLRGQVSDLVA
ncbi:hypothetical protein H2198_004877 [Neophaeococcomyces mojaviensis]|uniref:Uncharacterized protein n=1 Tax=Neophaeococcomyces mojaviensis TaxID=3383035 RepID=A0ACC3A7N3_9EURO|nr:hypothetical protein H2198_004877 [Knufia sp. JES_112]